MAAPKSADELRRQLRRIDGRGYPAYKDLRGGYAFDGLELWLDHVQGDPFAAPSRLRLRVPAASAQLPAELRASRVQRVALADFLAREAARALHASGARRRGSGRSGVVHVDAGGQQVLERSACVVDDACAELRLAVGLPAAGRRVLGREAEALLCEALPRLAERALRWRALSGAEARAFVACVENQEALRAQLAPRGLLAFVGDGAVLPRESGASDLPLRGGAVVPFRAPDSLRVALRLAHPIEAEHGARHELTGMGIPSGVTLLVGGGYHGKSTLLRALERGIQPHVPGDGREWVVCDRGLVTIRAESGRRVEQVDISAFVGELPDGRSTRAFSSDDASGSTSQAASIVEALETGASGLLLDEDTCATNFMVRDARMQQLVPKPDEPITPFVERVREIHERHGVSSVIVMGGCGDYFEAADRVVAMRAYRPEEVTAQARAIAARSPTQRQHEAGAPFERIAARLPVAASFSAASGRRAVAIDVRALDRVRFGDDELELGALAQIVEPSQTRAIAHAIHLLATHLMDGRTPLGGLVKRLEAWLDEHGLDALDPFHRPGHHPGDFARPRALEVAAAINRLRSARLVQQP